MAARVVNESGPLECIGRDRDACLSHAEHHG
jgi:hypothetical protein